MFTDAERRFLNYYKKGNYVRRGRGDERMLRKFSSIGIMRCGVDKKAAEYAEYEETAGLTPLGKRMLRKANLLHNPFTKVLYRLATSIYY